MTDDPRVNALRVFLYEHCCVGEKEKLAPLLLAGLDAVDPLRQRVSQDRVEAALDAYMQFAAEINADLISNDPNRREAINAALAAADRVQAPAEKPDFPPWMRLLQLMSQWVLWESASDPQYNEIKAAYDAAFPETQDATS